MCVLSDIQKAIEKDEIQPLPDERTVASSTAAESWKMLKELWLRDASKPLLKFD